MLIPPDPLNPLNPKPDYINNLEHSGKYIAEKKYNGDNVLYYTNTKQFWNRHKNLLHYIPCLTMKEELCKLPENCILNGELLHNKTKETKHTLIIHCIMVWNNKPLIDKTWKYSRNLLEKLTFGNHIQLSPLWTSNFFNLWSQTDGYTIEGIILKNPKGILKISTSYIPDVSWMLKIRKPNKKYSF